MVVPVDRIAFEGLVNARDLGGPPLAGGGAVRRGVLYRSETPELMSPADVAKAIDELELRRTIDLRGSRGRAYPLGEKGRRRAIDFFALAGGDRAIDGSDDGFLPSLLAEGGRPVGRVLELLVEAGGPCLVHCHTGKDRTGFVSALTLALVGATDEAIIADYEASIPVYQEMLANLEAVGLGVPPDAPPYALSPPSSKGIRAMLAGLRSGWSSARAYLLDQGLSSDLLDRAAALLIDRGDRTEPADATDTPEVTD